MTEQIGVALVGFGYWGANLARNLVAAPSTRLVGVSDASEQGRSAAERSLPGIRTWPSLTDALADPEVEAVVLATPASTHEALALEAIAAGRHVLVEKPLATTVAGAQRITEAGAAAGLVVMVGHTFLYSGAVRRMKQYIDDAELGRIQYLSSERLSLGRIRRDCNALWNFAPHDVSIMLYLLDERPSRVSATGFSFVSKGIDDVCFASLTFPSGIGASITVSWLDPRKSRLMTVVGDEKMLIYDDVSPDQKLSLFDAGVARSPEGAEEYQSVSEFQWKTRAGDILVPRLELKEPLLVEMDSFGRACRGEDAYVADGRHGTDVVRVLAAIDESAAAGGAPVEPAW